MIVYHFEKFVCPMHQICTHNFFAKHMVTCSPFDFIGLPLTSSTWIIHEFFLHEVLNFGSSNHPKSH